MNKEIRIFPPSDGEPTENQSAPINCADDVGVLTNPELAAEGWERRSLVDPARASEFIELYESLGFEVIAQKLTPEDFSDTCRDCASVVCQTYILIYTRKLRAS